MNILFINHRVKECGVYQFGLNVYNIIKNSKLLNITYIEANSQLDVNLYKDGRNILLFNYYPSTMPWVNHNFLRQLKRERYKLVSIFHEVPITGFDYYIHPDPTFENHDNHFKTTRPLLNYSGEYPKNDKINIGSFGFGFTNKGWDRIISLVNDEFDEATINFQMSFAHFGDKDGKTSRLMADYCRKIPIKSGIDLNISHKFLNQDKVLNFLAGNDINIFLYDEMYGRGISSVIDLALSVKRPIALSKSYMFRHLFSEPNIFVENTSLKSILDSGTKPLEKFYDEFSNDNLIKDYEEICKHITKS